VSHYRDERNPEAVHFPACLHVMALHGALAVILVFAVLLMILFDQPEQMNQDLLLMFGCGAALALVWPHRITTDQHGVRRVGLLGFGKRFIPWKDVRSVTETAEIPLLPRRLFGCLPNYVIVIRAAEGIRPIRFTSRHSSRETFLHELKRWGAPGL
jgi:hypothetical protein